MLRPNQLLVVKEISKIINNNCIRQFIKQMEGSKVFPNVLIIIHISTSNNKKRLN